MYYMVILVYNNIIYYMVYLQSLCNTWLRGGVILLYLIGDRY